jgi:hypothetical protein
MTLTPKMSNFLTRAYKNSLTTRMKGTTVIIDIMKKVHSNFMLDDHHLTASNCTSNEFYLKVPIFRNIDFSADSHTVTVQPWTINSEKHIEWHTKHMINKLTLSGRSGNDNGNSSQSGKTTMLCRSSISYFFSPVSKPPGTPKIQQIARVS